MEYISEDRQLNYLGFSYGYRTVCPPEPDCGKPPVMLLSGAFQDKNSWKKYTSCFCQDYRVILVDLPGAGESDLLPCGYDLAYLTEALNRVVQDLKAEKILPYSVGFGTSPFFRDINAFQMYWHAAGMRTRYEGKIVFNGEIYNYREIKEDLFNIGHHFISESDTEVIVHAYAEWGKECLHRFTGMFAIVIYDDIKKELFCCLN